MSIERSAGILLPVFSLPSDYGIGTFGREAYEFVDFLEKSSQTYWQILPIGQTSYGDSPYQSFSSNAGNPYFIDLDLLIEDRLLTKKDVRNLKNDKYIDYGYLFETRYQILYKAYLKGIRKYSNEFVQFRSSNADWLDDYALFMAVKKHFNNVSWQDWPDEEIKKKEEKAVLKYQSLLKDDMEFYSFVQYLFFRQFYALKEYANERGIKIIGDLPIYVALDSCDVWSNASEFLLDERCNPTQVAGVPPDYFSKDGQLWGNPLYNWDRMKENGYKWWIERVSHTSRYYDVIRIDHFRGFSDYYSIRNGSKTAKKGKWIKGPGMDFVRVLRDWFYNVDFIAEDLGIITDNVTELLKESGFPGMKVLEFGTDLDGSSTHMPSDYTENCVCYTGTHDNKPILGWLKTLDRKTLDYLTDYYALNEKEGYSYGFVRAGMASCARLFVCQIQDYLSFDETATINNPGTMNNWRWRLDKEDLTDELADRIKKMTYRYNRKKDRN